MEIFKWRIFYGNIKKLFHLWNYLFEDWFPINTNFTYVIDPNVLRPVSIHSWKVLRDSYDHMMLRRRYTRVYDSRICNRHKTSTIFQSRNGSNRFISRWPFASTKVLFTLLINFKKVYVYINSIYNIRL